MSLRTGAVLAFALLVAGAAPGCSLVFGWNDLGEGAGAGSDGGEGGASNDAPDGPRSEASDGETRDSAASLCASPHDLCDDFTSPTFPDLTRWTTYESGGASTGARVTDVFVSAPASFRVTAVDSDSIALVKSLSGPMKRLVCEFSVQARPAASERTVFRTFSVEALPLATSPIKTHSIGFSTVQTDYGALNEFWTTKDGGADGWGGGPSIIPSGQWVRVRFELTVGTPATVRLSYNGGVVGSIDLKNFPELDALVVRFGGMTEYPAAGGTAHLDDIVCDVSR